MAQQRTLIYGFNSRTGGLTKERTHLTFAKLLKTAYEDLGHVVHVGFPPKGLSAETLHEYDTVFMGLASPNSITSDRTYVASYMIGHLWGTGKLVFFFDDPDIRKCFYGVGNWLQNPNPSHLFRHVFRKRKLWYDMELYPSDARKWTDWHIEVMKMIINPDDPSLYPKTIIPGFPWIGMDWFKTQMPAVMRDNVSFIDPSPMVGVRAPKEDDDTTRIKEWVSDNILTIQKRTVYWKQFQHTLLPVNALRTLVTDGERVAAYRKAWGVLDEPITSTAPGWWTKTLPYAMATGALYLTEIDQVAALGESFNFLPASVEHLSMDERDELAARQRESFQANIWTMEQLKTALEEVIFRDV